jgi:capsular polysaccharide biosynthesis protein
MTLLELLQLLKKKWYLLVIFPIVFAIVAAAYCWGFMTNDYSSSVSLYVLAQNEDTQTTSSTTSNTFTASQQIANDLAVIAETDKVKTTAAKKLGLSSLDNFTVSVDSSTGNRVITLTVTGKNPDAVAKVADELAAQVADTAIDVMDLKAVNILDSAQIAETPSGPNRPMYTAIAFLAGLFCAIALIVLLDLLDTTVKSSKEAEEEFGLPVLGNMPMVKGNK